MGGARAADADALRHQETRIRIRRQLVRLHWVAAGPRPDHHGPLVLLHGMASSWRQWRGTLGRLGRDLPLAALDFPGFGLSGLTRRPLAASDYADACEAWCRANGFGRVAAVGHSFGGAVLLDWAARYPRRFRSLGLIAPAAVFHEWYTAGYRFLRWPVIGRLLVPIVVWLVSTRWLGPRMYGHVVARLENLTEQEKRDLQWGFRRAREMCRAIDYYRFPHLQEHLGRIRAPVVVGWGTDDRVVPYTDAEVYLSRLPQARLVSFEACGHVPMVEQRLASDALLRDVWRAAPGGVGATAP